MSATIAVLGTLACAGMLIFGCWLLYKRAKGDPVHLEWKGFKLAGPLGLALAALGIFGIVSLASGYSGSLERENKRLDKVNQKIQRDLDASNAAAAKLQANLTGAQNQATEQKTRADNLQSQLAEAQRARNEAQRFLTDTMRFENAMTLSPAQKHELDKLNGDIDKLNVGLSSLRIKPAYWPRLSGQKAVATYEIYDKDNEDESSTPRGAGLLLFPLEQYAHTWPDKLKAGLAKFICDASTSAILNHISPAAAIAASPELRDYPDSGGIIQILTDFTYLGMKLKLLAARSLVLVRGYADGQQASWRRPLDPSRSKITLHEIDPTPREAVIEGLDFRSDLSTIPVGRPDAKYAQYGNEDLPDLRAEVTAEMIATVVGTCPPPAGLNAAGNISVEILQGQVYPDKSKNDRKARVHLLIFLRQP